MKKIISGIMAMALALLLVIQPNSVVKAESVSLSVSASTVNVGDTVSVTVVEKIKEQQEIIEDEKDDNFSSGDIIEDKITVLDKKQ